MACYKRRVWVNPPLFICFIIGAIVIIAFVSISYFYGFFDFVKNISSVTVVAPPYPSPTQLIETTKNGIVPCTVNGCPFSNNLRRGEMKYYYVTIDDMKGYDYTFVVYQGSYAEGFGGFKILPVYPVDILPPQPSDLDHMEIIDFSSCSIHYIAFYVAPLTTNHSGTFNFTLKASFNEDLSYNKNNVYIPLFTRCGNLSLFNLICILVGVVGGLLWLLNILFWFGYSLATKSHAIGDEGVSLLHGDL